MKPFLALLCAVLLAAPMPALADISRDEAAGIAQKTSAARVLAVEKTQHDGRAVWRVKVLTPAGEIRIVLIDASSGRTL
ncbi:peptidase propeptide and YPEB domain protein [mine drainage metagenome]|uniref:Peptidase propeptide and YPEB domain protein n=1 Tax=mine drainage metagenome TaxID=410659 RepID=A0A1J5QEF2_9ZZZZ